MEKHIGGISVKTIKKRIRILTVTAAAVAMLSTSVMGAYENTHRNTGNQNEDILKVSLTQLGYTEGNNNLTKFGQWYATVLDARKESSAGFANGAWCAMYTSWCANQAGIKENTIPYYALVADGVEKFKKMNLYKKASEYTPKPGDLVFFDWNVNNYADHTGIVMMAEDGMLYSIEGNTAANRLDGQSNPSSSTAPDFCLVRQRPLNDRYIMGYATPKYTGGSFNKSQYDGYIDLEAGQKAASIRALRDGAMDATSSHTFGPYYGMTRGAFADFLCRVFDLDADISGTTAFTDVPKTHEYYKPVTVLKKLGLTSGVGNNAYKPDVYLTVTEGRFMVQAACRYVGLDMPKYDYTGDPAGKYLRRFEIAKLYTDLAEGSVSLATAEKLTVTDTSKHLHEVPGIALRGDAYIRLSDWNTLLEGTEQENMTASGGTAGSSTKWVQEGTYEIAGLGTKTARQITYQEEAYFNLADLASALGLQAVGGSDTHFTLLKGNVAVADNVRIAALHDYSAQLKEEQLYAKGSYSVTATVTSDQKKVLVEVRAADVKSHTNIEGNKGYWTGFAILAPEGATQVRFSRSGNTQGLTSGIIAVEADGTSRGLVMTYDLNTSSGKEELLVQWIGENGSILQQTFYTVDLSGAQKEGNYVEPFKDVLNTAWYSEAVRYTKSYGIMDGTSANTFGPGVKFTRAMVAQVVYAMEGKPNVSYAEAFKDVKANDWFAPAICWASQHDVVSGYTNGNYGPNDNVTREQMIAILYKYAAYRGGNVNWRGEIKSFKDMSSISKWAEEPMQWAVGAGLLSGRENGMLDPKGNAVRSEVAQILMQFHKKYIAA